MNKLFILILVLVLSGCVTQHNGDADLLKGEVYQHTQTLGEKELEHEIKLKEDEFYRFTIHFF